MAKVPYTKLIDRQKRNQTYGGQVDVNSPSVDVEEIKRLLAGGTPDLSKYGLPFDEVRCKIDEAISATRSEEKVRYESTIRSLDSQLTNAKKRVSDLEIALSKSSKSSKSSDDVVELIDKYKNEVNVRGQRIEKLTSELKSLHEKYKESLESKNVKIRKLEGRVIELENESKSKDDSLRKKDDIIVSLSTNSTNKDDSRLTELQSAVTKLITKIESGEVGGTSKESNDKSPTLQDRVFIDPVEDNGSELDPHISINIDAVSAAGGRNLQSDLTKLKSLLNKGKYKPVQGKLSRG